MLVLLLAKNLLMNRILVPGYGVLNAKMTHYYSGIIPWKLE